MQGLPEQPSAVISRYGGRLNITANSADFNELKEFINVIGFSEIFTEKSTALALGFNAFTEYTSLKKQAEKTKNENNVFSLLSLYNTLNLGADGEIELPSFEVFAPDVSHRLRHGAAFAVLKEFGGALTFKSNFGGIINGISVKKDARKGGFGSLLLNDILKQINGEVFVCTTTSLAEFYIKNGFTVCDTAVLVRG